MLVQTKTTEARHERRIECEGAGGGGGAVKMQQRARRNEMLTKGPRSRKIERQVWDVAISNHGSRRRFNVAALVGNGSASKSARGGRDAGDAVWCILCRDRRLKWRTTAMRWMMSVLFIGRNARCEVEVRDNASYSGMEQLGHQAPFVVACRLLARPATKPT